MLNTIPSICWVALLSRLPDHERWELVCRLSMVSKVLNDIFIEIKYNDKFEFIRKLYIPTLTSFNIIQSTIIQSTVSHIAEKYNSSQKWIVYISDYDSIMRNAYNISKMIIAISPIFNIAFRCNYNNKIYNSILDYYTSFEKFDIDPDRISSLDQYSIKLFDLSDQGLLVSFLSRTTQLTSLDLTRRYPSINYELRYFIPIIAKLPQLTYLNLTGTIGEYRLEDDIALLTSIQLPKLTTLNMSNCQLGGRERHVQQLLNTKPNLTALDLSNNKLNNVSQILPCLEKMKYLQSLNLSRNDISTPVARSIMETIAKLPHIKEIDLSHNSIGNDGAIYIISFIGRMAQLTVLNLEYNCIHKRTIDMLKHRIKSFGRNNMTVNWM
jgi:Ran GTPase-activating protein (RanGAP) involved in mRNA processing and transport